MTTFPYYMSDEAKIRWEAGGKSMSEEEFARYYHGYESCKQNRRVADMTDEQFVWYTQDEMKAKGLPKVPPVYKEPLDLANTNLSEAQIKVVRRFLNDIDNRDAEKQGLYIFGGPGTGKTRLAHIMRRLLCLERYKAMQQGQRLPSRNHPLFYTISELLRQVRRDFDLGMEEKTNPVERILDLKSPLFLDDMGAEKATDWSLETVFAIVNDRCEWKKPTVYTSNLNIQQLSESLGDRIASRIAGSCILLDLGNVDRRINL